MAHLPLCFVTTNAGKVREAEALLGRPVAGVALELEELQSPDLGQVVRHKTEQAFLRLARPLLVEDTALAFGAWQGLPGPFIKFFLARLGPAGLVRAVAPTGDFSAVAASGLGFHDGATCHYFEGRVAGKLVEPRGERGFGWDAIFQPQGADLTFAEMTAEQKNAHSMRGRAFAELNRFLQKGGI